MYDSKRSQIILISGFLVLLVLVFIYSLETENSYIVYSAKSSLLENIMHETCQVGIMSNGSYIDVRFGNFSADVLNYCQDFAYNCTLNIQKNGDAPDNLSELNYTHYTYSVIYSAGNYNNSYNFTC